MPVSLSYLLYFFIAKLPEKSENERIAAHKKCCSAILKKLEASDYPEFVQLLMEAAQGKISILLMIVVVEASSKLPGLRAQLSGIIA
jgi:hypothetical protein